MSNSPPATPHSDFGDPLPRSDGGDGTRDSFIEQDVTGTLEEHWRKGIPTLILLLLAAFVSGYYWMLVKPGLHQRYSKIIERNLKQLGMDGVDGLKSNSKVESSDSELSPEKRIEILKETQLSIRRLIGWNSADDSVHYRYGIVSQAIATGYLQEAIRSGHEAVSQYLGIAKTEQQNAMGAMERVRKLNKTFANRASLWLVKRKIDESLSMPTDDLLLLEKTVRPLMEQESIASSAKTILAQILVERALRQSSELDLKQRLELLTETDQLLRSVANTDSVSLSLQAEAIVLVDAEKGREIANKALQEFWSTREAQTQSVESLAAAFRCLLIIDSMKEGQVFLSEQLQQLTAMDQNKFRAATAAAALRHVISIAIREVAVADGVLKSPSKAKGAIAPSNAEVMLSLAIQLAPESPELIALLTAISKPTNNDQIISWIKNQFAMDVTAGIENRKQPVSPENGVRPFFNAVVGLGNGALTETTLAALTSATKLSPAYGVAASRLVLHMAIADALPTDQAIRWLQTINFATPDVLVAWSDRASLHHKNKQPAEAIKCLEFLLEKLPGNAQITEAIEAAKMQLKIAE